MRTRKIVASALALGITCAVPSVGHAAPKNGDVFQLDCGGSTYEVIANSNGNWSPGHVIGSNKMFIPTNFGTFAGTVYNANGEIVDSFTDDEPRNKGRSTSGRKAIVDCVFSFTFESDGSDPEFPEGWTFVGSGDVSGFFSR